MIFGNPLGVTPTDVTPDQIQFSRNGLVYGAANDATRVVVLSLKCALNGLLTGVSQLDAEQSFRVEQKTTFVNLPCPPGPLAMTAVLDGAVVAAILQIANQVGDPITQSELQTAAANLDMLARPGNLLDVHANILGIWATPGMTPKSVTLPARRTFGTNAVAVSAGIFLALVGVGTFFYFKTRK